MARQWFPPWRRFFEIWSSLTLPGTAFPLFNMLEFFYLLEVDFFYIWFGIVQCSNFGLLKNIFFYRQNQVGLFRSSQYRHSLVRSLWRIQQSSDRGSRKRSQLARTHPFFQELSNVAASMQKRTPSCVGNEMSRAYFFRHFFHTKYNCRRFEIPRARSRVWSPRMSST